MSDTPSSTAADRSSHGQRLAALYTRVAIHQAAQQRRDLDRLNDALLSRDLYESDTDPERQVLDREIGEVRDLAYDRLVADALSAGPETDIARLATALVWSAGDDPELGEAARGFVAERVENLAQNWGISLDRGTDFTTWTVGIDPEFDAAAVQQLRQARLVQARGMYAVDVLTGMGGLSEAELAAVDAYALADEVLYPTSDTGAVVTGVAQRRAALSQRLEQERVPESRRRDIEFVVDYTAGDVSAHDLRQSPALVDPGIEARGRIQDLLRSFAAHHGANAAEIAAEISVMSPSDQERVRSAGRAIRDERPGDHTRMWPDHANRGRIQLTLEEFVDATRDVARYADAGADTEIDEVLLDRIADAEYHRSGLQDMMTGEGLHPAEVAMLDLTIEDIDQGRVTDPTRLPELMFLDERTKRRVDLERHDQAAEQIATTGERQVIDLLNPILDQPVQHQADLDRPLYDLAVDIQSIGLGTGTRSDHTQTKQHYDRTMGEFGVALRDAGVPVPTRMQVRRVLDATAETAYDHGASRAQREQVWDARLHAPAHQAAVADAVAAGHAHPPGRACTTRPDITAGTMTPTGPGARISRLHHSEVGR
ncbi:hypothetical protein [Nocardia sp. alder85J]|uniref:hypothetical protein n=1 Tax=Nocardia sp. alder85J TaxID=2862949 RepID=UPI001CD7EF43|nr:hypothetical protein [Nocardia sp. alder85J]MCX4099220.1 hypothetical protein [Nocardia sp. alder85J]